MNFPPQIPRMQAFKDSSKMIKNPIRVFEKYRQQLGDTFSFHFGGYKKAMVTCNPEVMQHVLKTNYLNYHKSEIQTKRMGHFLGPGLLTSHGKYWLTQRRLIQQGFHRTQLAVLMQAMQVIVEQTLDKFDSEVDAGPIDINSSMRKLTFKTVTSSLFSTSLSDEKINQLSNSIAVIQEFMVKQIVQPYLNGWFRLSGELGKYEKVRYEADKIILNYVCERRKDTSRYNDMLQILMDATYEDTGKGMNDEQLLSESMQLLVAGHETSSTVLAWTLYLLCRHRHYIDEIRKEIRTLQMPLQLSTISKLTYTTQVLEEAMRLYPPFWMVDRVAQKDDQVAGIDIPAGTMLIAYIYGVHHASKYWEHPEKFMPERFSEENKKMHMPFTHIPFGGGPRGCIGGNYAMMQMLVVLTALIKRYDFLLIPDTPHEIQPRLILKSKGDIKIQFTKINTRKSNAVV